MAHFAQVIDGRVVNVVVIDNENLLDASGVEQEALGQQYLASIGLDGQWVQTSYSGAFRGHFAGVGAVWTGSEFVAPPLATEPSESRDLGPDPRHCGIKAT